MTYDHWKTTNPADALPAPPPCERSYRLGEQHKNPRFPSGDCVECGALCTESCRHPDYPAWEAL